MQILADLELLLVYPNYCSKNDLSFWMENKLFHTIKVLAYIDVQGLPLNFRAFNVVLRMLDVLQ